MHHVIARAHYYQCAQFLKRAVGNVDMVVARAAVGSVARAYQQRVIAVAANHVGAAALLRIGGFLGVVALQYLRHGRAACIDRSACRVREAYCLFPALRVDKLRLRRTGTACVGVERYHRVAQCHYAVAELYRVGLYRVGKVCVLERTDTCRLRVVVFKGHIAAGGDYQRFAACVRRYLGILAHDDRIVARADCAVAFLHCQSAVLTARPYISCGRLLDYR